MSKIDGLIAKKSMNLSAQQVLAAQENIKAQKCNLTEACGNERECWDWRVRPLRMISYKN